MTCSCHVVQLTKNVSSTEAAAAAAAAKKKAGLDAVLESLQSAKKVCPELILSAVMPIGGCCCLTLHS